MSPEQENDVLSALYDRLFQIITYAPAGQASQFNKQNTFIQFAKNQALKPADFKNARSPVNPNGALTTAELFSRMVDIQPALRSDYAPTANIISDTFTTIVNGANTALTPNPAQ